MRIFSFDSGDRNDMIRFRTKKNMETNSNLYLLTLRTQDNYPWFDSDENRKRIAPVMRHLVIRFNNNVYDEDEKFEIKAWVILLDHIHMLIKTGHSNYNQIVNAFKQGVHKAIMSSGVVYEDRELWQDGFYSQSIPEDDIQKFIDYIHQNPVLHKLVAAPSEWWYSSFHKYVKLGSCDKDWNPDQINEVPDIEWDISTAHLDDAEDQEDNSDESTEAELINTG